jgi:hypothetical protein
LDKPKRKHYIPSSINNKHSISIFRKKEDRSLPIIIQLNISREVFSDKNFVFIPLFAFSKRFPPQDSEKAKKAGGC